MKESLTDAGLLDVVSRRRVAAGTAFCVGLLLAVLAALIVKPSYGAVAHVLLVNDQQGRDPSAVSLDMPTIATSKAVLDEVRNDLRLTTSIPRLQDAINVRVAPRSSIMSVTVKDHDPSRAVSIANAVAQHFVKFYASISGNRYQQVIDQLDATLAAHRRRMVGLDSRLQQQAAGAGYSGSQTSLDTTMASLGQLVTQRTLAYSQLVTDQAQLDSSRATTPQLSKIVKHEMLANDQQYHTLEINVAHDNANFIAHRSAYTDRFPGIADQAASMTGEFGALQRAEDSAIGSSTAYSPSLAGQIVQEQRSAASLDGDRARVRDLDSQIEQIRGGLAGVSPSGENLSAVRAQRDTEEAQYQALALRLSNAQSNKAEANSLGSAVVIDHAVTAQANLIGPNFVLFVGFLVALLLAVGVAYLADAIDKRFLSSGDVETLYGRPLLGSLNRF